MKLRNLFPLSVLALAACSSAPRTPEYACPLDTVAQAKCASVEQAYKASRSANKEGLAQSQSVFDPRAQSTAAQTSAPQAPVQGQLSAYPEPGQQGLPVFQQPKVMRVWVAPYVDADGNLRSGEYTYFSTPGQWNYGDLKKPGAASGIFEPAKPGNLGFTPTAKPTDRKTPATPAAPALPTSTGKPAAPAAAGAPAAANAPAPSNVITQPYQRLDQK